MKKFNYSIMIKYLSVLVLLLSPVIFFGQDKEEDPKKMFRDIVNVDVDRAKYSPKPAVVTPTETVDPKKKKKHHVEEVPAETPLDTLPPTMPAPQQEIVKRAQAWYQAPVPNKKYTKTNGSNSGKSVTCVATFIFKQKVLNPVNEVDGKFVMDVIIEAKEGKYRYTVKNIKHVATKAGMSGGDVFELIPEAGSMAITDRTWILIKEQSMKSASIVVDDLKAFMKNEIHDCKDEW
jgi:hypothetical protein